MEQKTSAAAKRHPALSRRYSSSITLPAIHISKRSAIAYTIVVLVSVVASIETLWAFVVSERALLTTRGRERHRTRRRAYMKSRRCDETDEPGPWQFMGWRRLASCVEYDLSLRRRQLGDAGVRRLARLLGRTEYATRHHRGQLRVLNLQRQGITRWGAGYLARWLSVDPVEADSATDDLVDVDRMPTAASRYIFINLEGNPIGIHGVKDLERAVDKARINGIRVTIVGGGDSREGQKAGRHHTVKLGPIVYTADSFVDMPPWRLPVPLFQKLKAKAEGNPLFPGLKWAVAFCLGLAAGRATSSIPYAISIVPGRATASSTTPTPTAWENEEKSRQGEPGPRRSDSGSSLMQTFQMGEEESQQISRTRQQPNNEATHANAELENVPITRSSHSESEKFGGIGNEESQQIDKTRQQPNNETTPADAELENALNTLSSHNDGEKLEAGAHMLYLYCLKISKHPLLPRYRKIYTDNSTFRGKVGNLAGAREVLAAVGFEERGGFLEWAGPGGAPGDASALKSRLGLALVALARMAHRRESRLGNARAMEQSELGSTIHSW